MVAHMHMCMCVCLGEAFTSGVAPVFSFLTGKSADSVAGITLVLWPCDLGLNPVPWSVKCGYLEPFRIPSCTA